MTGVPKLERVFTVLALAYYAKAFAPFTNGFEVGTYSAKDAAGGNVTEQLAALAVYGTTLVLIARNGNWFGIVCGSPVLCAFLALTAASMLWSSAPDITIRREFGLLGTALFGLYLAQRYDAAQIVRAVAGAFAIAIATSVLLIALVPSVAIIDGEQLAGTFGHKNNLGRAMAIAAIAFWAVARDRSAKPPIWILPALAAALVAVLLAKSAQAVAATVLSLAVLTPLLTVLARAFSRVDLGLLLTLALTGLAAWLLGTVGMEQALGLLGRDATLTDRTVIWDILTEFGLEKPWLGRGYGAFWFSDAALFFGDHWDNLDHAHNGYMDLWLDLGRAGLAGFMVLLASAILRTLDAYLADPSPATRFFPLFVFAGIVLNFVGRVFPDYNSIYWVLLCYCALLPKAGGHPARAPHGFVCGPAWPVPATAVPRGEPPWGDGRE